MLVSYCALKVLIEHKYMRIIYLFPIRNCIRAHMYDKRRNIALRAFAYYHLNEQNSCHEFL